VYNNNGSATAQSTGNGLPAQVRNLTISNTANTTLTAPSSVAQVLAITSSGAFNPNSQTLTLLSNATGTALLANLGGGQVSGSLTVQRYIDPSRNAGLGYRHLAAPVFAATVAAFGSGGTTPVVNSAYNSAANPNAVTPFPTVFSYDQSRLATSPATTLAAFDKGWVSPASLTDAASLAFTGFTVQLPGASTLSFVGQVAQTGGTIPMSRTSGATAADAGFNLIGNPYASPLDFSTIPASQRTNLDAAYYIFESTSQYGGSYRSYVNGIGTSSLIGTAQGFFMRVSSGSTSGSLALTNANRATTYGQQAPVRRTASLRPLVQLDLAGQNLADAFYAYAETGATAGFDGEYDAAKLPNTHGLNLSTTRGTTEPLAIDGRAAFTAATSFPLTVGVPAAGTYTFTAAQLANLPAGLTAYLYDAATGSSTALSAGSVYSFQVSAAQAATPVAGRFTLQFSPAAPLAAAPAALAAQVSIFPNHAHEQVTVSLPGIAGATAVQAELLNALGQVVRRQETALPAAGTAFGLPTAGLAPGVYVLRLTAGTTLITKRLTIQ
ncbi:MAG: T9SS type A sorting domain-containing protein, partial [Cytophagaceae bacterium]